MNSSLYFGKVSHHRRAPKVHNLAYRVYMAHLFLDELPTVFKNRLLWSFNRSNISSFHRTDYHRPEIESLEQAVRETINQQLDLNLSGRISILTHLRTFGYCFNPVTFYYLWDEKVETPKAILTEITNTPWGEKYAKALQWESSQESGKSSYEFEKEFHVSPFIGMKVDYDWRFRKPSENLQVDMFLREKNKLFFSAHLQLKKKTISFFNLAWALLRFPLITFKIIWGIYWHALLLRLKGCPFFTHPKNLVPHQ